MNHKNTITTLQNLLFSENKPAALKPIDVALVTYLVLRQTEDHFIHDSQLTLASRLGCSRDAIADSIKRLDGLGWMVVEKPWQFNPKTKNKTRVIGKTVGLAVNLEKLPTPKDRTKHSKVSAAAVDLAQQHTNILIRADLQKKQVLRRPKNFKRFQETAAQRLIDELGDEGAVEVLNFALREKRFQKAAHTSLYKVRERLPAIKVAFDAAEVASKKTAQPAQIAS